MVPLCSIFLLSHSVAEDFLSSIARVAFPSLFLVLGMAHTALHCPWSYCPGSLKGSVKDKATFKHPYRSNIK